ncbi:TSC22 domain family protein 1 isoform X2 [Engraulis encrasicolus]|uniref:TSC22 domain family protein 1 isoform X2 n=1 Tax=Engraulis encrasicolus TaxID=184585 RepID=UPI002FD1E533
MSGGKKRSGFQITSVTSDYSQWGGQADGRQSPSQSAPAAAEGTPAASAGPALSNGGQIDLRAGAVSPSLPHRLPTSEKALSGHQDITSTLNGPAAGFLTLSPPSSMHLVMTDRSSSQPATPVMSRRQSAVAGEQSSPGGGSGSGSSVLSSSGGASRFRVVRLGQVLGEPYKRGRWTCVDQLERPEPEPRLRRVLDSMRHAHSLESLETVGLGGGGVGVGVVGVDGAAVGGAIVGPGGGGGGGGVKPLGLPRGLRGAAGGVPMVHSQGTTHLLMAQQPQHQLHLRGEGGAHSGPPSPTHGMGMAHGIGIGTAAAMAAAAGAAGEPALAGLTSPGSTPSRLRNVPPPLRLDMDATGKFRMTQSQPSSPGPHTAGRDGLFHPSLTPIQTPSALALAQSMFGVGGAFEVDESGTGNSAMAIDNKIEQAMDLVKTHLMLAVREEVELLREQIKELTEKNAQLERENYILKALRDRH